MIQLVTQYAGFGLFAQIALALFFIAFLMILVTTFIRPKSQMQHFARMALTDGATPDPAVASEVPLGVACVPGVAPGSNPGSNPGSSHDKAPGATDDHGVSHHE